MARRIIYIVFIIIFVIIFGTLAVGYFYVSREAKIAQETGVPQTPGGFFGSLYSLFNGNSAVVNTPGTLLPTTATTTITSDTGLGVTIPRLREVSSEPVAGATFLVRNIASTTIRTGKLT